VNNFSSFGKFSVLNCLAFMLACSQAPGPAAGSGGATATGGALGGGGAPVAGTGGVSASGGAVTGGVPGAGGIGSGGAPSPSGGAPGTGGSVGSGGSNGAFTSAADLVASLTLGWNLGNSLDAPDGETGWGNPTVTPALLSAVAAAGFDAVRIPVTWSMHTGASPGYVIDSAFMTRVEEVVGYANAAGLVAIINVHHDGAEGLEGVEWLKLEDASGNVTEENNTAVRERFLAVWTQIATHFKDHGPDLLFESMNEIHVGYDAPDPAYYDVITDLNQEFVDLVRSTGGNNLERCLVVPGYNTNIDYTVAGFEVPTDPTADRLILSVHFYDPWSYAGEGSTHTWGVASPNTDSWGQEDFVVTQYDKLVASFISQGLPMIVGEYGAVQQDGYEDYRRYYMEYVTKVMVDRGLLPFYWDNGGANSGADGFGLISRTDGSSMRPDILEAMMRAATSDYELGDVALPTP